jgi:hypothetical protein
VNLDVYKKLPVSLRFFADLLLEIDKRAGERAERLEAKMDELTKAAKGIEE